MPLLRDEKEPGKGGHLSNPPRPTRIPYHFGGQRLPEHGVFKGKPPAQCNPMADEDQTMAFEPVEILLPTPGSISTLIVLQPRQVWLLVKNPAMIGMKKIKAITPHFRTTP